MSPRTRDVARSLARMTELQWSYRPGYGFDYVADLTDALDPEDRFFHPRRQAVAAAEDRLVALFRATYLDIPGALL